jgi:hypothetical protein
VIVNLIINAFEAMSGLGERPRELLTGTAKAKSDSVDVAVQAQVWLQRFSIASLTSTTPQGPAVSSAYQSAVPSLKRMGDDCGRPQACPRVPSSISRCLRVQIVHLDFSARPFGKMSPVVASVSFGGQTGE